MSPNNDEQRWAAPAPTQPEFDLSTLPDDVLDEIIGHLLDGGGAGEVNWSPRVQLLLTDGRFAQAVLTFIAMSREAFGPPNPETRQKD